MGVFNQSIDFTAVGEVMGLAASQWMNAAIEIVDPNIGDETWNEWTNTSTGGEPTVIWSGPARIQHLGESIGDIGFSQIGVRRIRVQVPIDAAAGFIRKGLQVVVTNAGNDYELAQLQFTVTSAINSSYAWLRTLECEVDIKSPIGS